MQRKIRNRKRTRCAGSKKSSSVGEKRGKQKMEKERPRFEPSLCPLSLSLFLSHAIIVEAPKPDKWRSVVDTSGVKTDGNWVSCQKKICDAQGAGKLPRWSAL